MNKFFAGHPSPHRLTNLYHVARAAIALLVICLQCMPSASAQTRYPMLMKLDPVAIKVGTTSEHDIHANANMAGTFQVLVTGGGVAGVVVEPEEKQTKPEKEKKNKKPTVLKKIKIRFTANSDALPGVRDIRLITPFGASTLGQLVIVQDPIVKEAPKNDSPDKAQEISLPATICGAIEKREDVDYYKFHAEAGSILNFHVRATRLQNRIHDLQQHVDPIIAIKTTAGQTITQSDNTFSGDPFLSHQFETAGDYLLEIRDVRYGGNQYWNYSIEANDRPFVSSVHPAAIQKGKEAELTLAGWGLGEHQKAKLTIPEGSTSGIQHIPLAINESTIQPVAVYVTDLPYATESNDDNSTIEKAIEITVPGGVCGELETTADVDYFAFDANKGEKFNFKLIGSELQSRIDSIIRILDAEGKQKSINDDNVVINRRFPDSFIHNWSVPADGRYFIEVRDLHMRGGQGFPYVLKVERATPNFELFIDTDKTQLAAGASAVMFVRALRKGGFSDSIDLHIDGLPEGILAHCGRILAGAKDGCIILTAKADCHQLAQNVTVRGTAKVAGNKKDESTELDVVATPRQETYMPGGGRNHWFVDMHTVTVVKKSDIRKVKLSTYDVTLHPGETAKIDVEIERAEGFDKNVTLDMRFRHLSGVYGDTLPNGVNVDAKQSKTLLTGKNVKGHLTITAAKNAVLAEKQQVSVMANIALNFVMKSTFSSQPLFITVKKKPTPTDESKKTAQK